MGLELCNKKNETRHDFKLLSYGMAREKIGTCLILSADANFFVPVCLIVSLEHLWRNTARKKKSGPKYTGIHLNQ